MCATRNALVETVVVCGVQERAQAEAATVAVFALPAQVVAGSSGDRPVEGVAHAALAATSPTTVTTQSEVLVPTSIMRVGEAEAVSDGELEMQEMIAEYDADVQRPSAF